MGKRNQTSINIKEGMGKIEIGKQTLIKILKSNWAAFFCLLFYPLKLYSSFYF